MKGPKRSLLDRLRAHAADTVEFLSNDQKPERERAVCRAFLRCLGVNFSEDEIRAPCPEPIDVSFREARFQIREILDKGRRRLDEWREYLDRWTKARSIDDVTEVSTPSRPMSPGDVTLAVVEALSKKAKKYGAAQCSTLDALVYINLKARHLYPTTGFGDTSALEKQDWRSVSILMPPYGVVMMARMGAPNLLRERLHKTLMEWESPDGLFDP